MKFEKASFDLSKNVLAQWNLVHAHQPFLQLREADLRWNLEEQNLVTYSHVHLADTPCLVGTASPSGIQAGLAEGTLFLNLWGHIATGNATRFVDDFIHLAKDAGKSKMLFGADEFHFLPGIPMNLAQHEPLLKAVSAAGFTVPEVVDYVGELTSTPKPVLPGFEFLVLENENQLKDLENFLAREFPGRWQRELQSWRQLSHTGRAFWGGLYDSNKTIVGFARMALRGRVQPTDFGWTPGALRLSLDEKNSGAWANNDCCLGPIGVAQSQRGQGSGRFLLNSVLNTLYRNDGKRICIDWTNAFKYYEPLKETYNLREVRRYGTAWMSVPGT